MTAHGEHKNKTKQNEPIKFLKWNLQISIRTDVLGHKSCTDSGHPERQSYKGDPTATQACTSIRDRTLQVSYNTDLRYLP